MIYSDGNIPFHEAFRKWRNHVEIHNGRLVDAWIARGDKEEDLLTSRTDLTYFGNYCTDGLRTTCITRDGKEYKISSKVCHSFEWIEFVQDFPFIEYLHDEIELGAGALEGEQPETISFVANFAEYGSFFPYLDPKRSMVCLSGLNSWIDLVQERVDFADILSARWLIENEAFDPQPNKAVREMEINRIVNNSMHSEILDYGLPIFRGHAGHFEHLEGASVSVCHAALSSLLKIEYPLEPEKIRATVAGEKSAFQQLSKHMSSVSPNFPTFAQAQAEFGAEIGERAFRRVWDLTRQEFPQIGKPGRRKKS